MTAKARMSIVYVLLWEFAFILDKIIKTNGDYFIRRRFPEDKDKPLKPLTGRGKEDLVFNFNVSLFLQRLQAAWSVKLKIFFFSALAFHSSVATSFISFSIISSFLNMTDGVRVSVSILSSSIVELDVDGLATFIDPSHGDF